MTTFRKFWARSAHFGQNGGWDESRGARFFCVVIQRTFRQLRNGRFSSNLVAKRISVSRRGIRKNIFENFHFRGHLPPKSKIGQTGTSLIRAGYWLQVTGCNAERYCLLHVVVQGPGSFRVRSTFLYDVRLWSYRASKLPNFRILAYFPIQNPQNVPSCDQPVAQNDSDFSMWWS